MLLGSLYHIVNSLNLIEWSIGVTSILKANCYCMHDYNFLKEIVDKRPGPLLHSLNWQRTRVCKHRVFQRLPFVYCSITIIVTVLLEYS